MKDKIVICVKEAIIDYKNEADYFIANNSRHRNFTFNENTIKVYQKSIYFKMNKDVTTDYDITLLEDDSYEKKRQLLKTHDFDKYNLVNNKSRPWGPGILYETVFYLCLFMGFKNVYTIGWDLIDTKNHYKITHYFEDYNSKEYKNSKLWNNRDFRKEMEMVNDNIPYFYDYLKEKGMNIFVVGEKSFVNKHIPRICL